MASQSLAQRSGLGVSSATVRNILAQLEEADYVHQPHSSSGRVPTDRGYRVFVDRLLEGRKRSRPSAEVETRLREQAERSPMMDDLLASASHLVSRAARHVGFALCDNPAAILQRIEFVALGGSRVLVVVISRGNQITQKVVDTGEDVRPDDLVQAENYLNTEFAGLPLIEVREAVLGRLQQERILYDQLLARALRLARSTLADMPRQQTFHVEGAASLLGSDAQPGVSLATLRALLEMMEGKERMVHLLNQYIDGPGLTVVIGDGTYSSAPPLVQSDRVYRGRWHQHPDRRRDRTHPDALFTRNYRCGRHHAGGFARASQHALIIWPIAPTIRTPGTDPRRPKPWTTRRKCRATTARQMHLPRGRGRTISRQCGSIGGTRRKKRTHCRTGCSGLPQSSITIASGSIAIAATRPTPRSPVRSRICCRSSTTSNAHWRRQPARMPTRIDRVWN